MTKTFVVEMSYISICFHCYVIAQQLPSPTYAVAMRLYQIIDNEEHACMHVLQNLHTFVLVCTFTDQVAMNADKGKAPSSGSTELLHPVSMRRIHYVEQYIFYLCKALVVCYFFLALCIAVAIYIITIARLSILTLFLHS